MAGDMWHIVILTQHAARRNPLRESFHTVCLIYARAVGWHVVPVDSNPTLENASSMRQSAWEPEPCPRPPRPTLTEQHSTWCRKRVPLDWAMTQNKPGIAQALLNERLRLMGRALVRILT
jgi:hypothetical protein